MDDNENNVIPLRGNKEQSLLSMSGEQREHALDIVVLDINRTLLEDARLGKEQDLKIALSILTMANGDERVITWGAEHGDGEGIGSEEDMVRQCRKFGLLQEGETIEVQLWKVVDAVEVPRGPEKVA